MKLSSVVFALLVILLVLCSSCSEEKVLSSSDKLVISLPGGVSLELAPVKGGKFTMGNQFSGTQSVLLNQDYYLGIYEVTEAQWRAVMGGEAIHGDNYPQTMISLDQMHEFCDKLNAQYGDKLPEGYAFCVPSEAQWEFAAMGGVNYQEGASCINDDCKKAAWLVNKEVRPVGEKAPNELGLYDMVGNVSECCEDFYVKYSTFWSKVFVLQNPVKEYVDDVYHIVRGGSCNGVGECPGIYRLRDSARAEKVKDDRGFRLACCYQNK